MFKAKRIMAVISFYSIAFTFLSPIAIGGEFELIGSIPSRNGLYYTTMAPQGDYIAMGDQRSPGAGIDIIYVADPANMVEVGHVQTGHMTYKLAWAGDFVYAPACWDGLFIYNVSDFNDIFPVADTSFGEPIYTVAIRGDIALVGGNNHMYSIDIGNPYNPRVIWSSSELGCWRIVLGDTIAYTINSGVVIMDISSPEYPQEITRFDCNLVEGIDVDLSERYMYLTAGDRGLIIYDIEDPASPQFVSETQVPHGAWCIDVCVSVKYPNIVFVSAYTGGLWAMDVSDPWNPVATAHYTPQQQSHYVISYQDIVFHTVFNKLLAFWYWPDPTGVGDEFQSKPSEISLRQNYPNPFNASTVLNFAVAHSGNVKLNVYNLVGQYIETLIDGRYEAGEYAVSWDAGGHSSGIYFYRIQAGDYTDTRKMLLIK